MANYTTIGQIDLGKWELIIPADVKKQHDEQLKWAKAHLPRKCWHQYESYSIKEVKFKLKDNVEYPVNFLKSE